MKVNDVFADKPASLLTTAQADKETVMHEMETLMASLWYMQGKGLIKLKNLDFVIGDDIKPDFTTFFGDNGLTNEWQVEILVDDEKVVNRVKEIKKQLNILYQKQIQNLDKIRVLLSKTRT